MKNKIKVIIPIFLSFVLFNVILITGLIKFRNAYIEETISNKIDILKNEICDSSKKKNLIWNIIEIINKSNNGSTLYNLENIRLSALLKNQNINEISLYDSEGRCFLSTSDSSSIEKPPPIKNNNREFYLNRDKNGLLTANIQKQITIDNGEKLKIFIVENPIPALDRIVQYEDIGLLIFEQKPASRKEIVYNSLGNLKDKISLNNVSKVFQTIKIENDKYYIRNFSLGENDSYSFSAIALFPNSNDMILLTSKAELISILGLTLSLLLFAITVVYLKFFWKQVESKENYYYKMLQDTENHLSQNYLAIESFSNLNSSVILIDENGEIHQKNKLADDLVDSENLFHSLSKKTVDIIKIAINKLKKRDFTKESNIRLDFADDIQRVFETDISKIKNIKDEELFCLQIRDITNKEQEKIIFKNAMDNLENRVFERTAEFKRSEEYLRTLIDNLPFNLWAKDLDGKFTMQNSKSKENWGNLIESDLYNNDLSNDLIDKLEQIEEKAYNGLIARKEIQSEDEKGLHILDTTILPVLIDSKLVGIFGIQSDITDRRLAEIKTRESQRMLKIVLDNIPAYVYWKNTNLEYLGCNRNQAKAAGAISPAEIIGKSDFDLSWTLAEAKAIRRSDETVVKTGRARFHIIEHLTNANGQLMWTESNKVPLRDEEGNIIGILGTYEDITQRKIAEEKLKRLNEELESRVSKRTKELEDANQKLQNEIKDRTEAEKALKVSEEKYKIIVENQKDLTVNVDLEGRINFASHSFCNTFGKGKEEIHGKKIIEFFDEKQYDRLNEYIEKIISDRGRGRKEILAKTKTDWRWLEWMIEIVYDVNGNITALLWVGRDIHERKKAEKQIKFLSRITQQVTDAVVATDLDFNITYINKACEKLYGYSPDELKNQNSEILLQKDMSKGLRKKILNEIDQGGNFYIELPNRRKFGREFICAMHFSAIVDDNNNPIAYVSIRQDITEKKAHEERIRKSEKQLKLVLESTEDGFWDWNLKTDEISLSYRASEMLEYSQIDIDSDFSNWLKLIHHQDREKVKMKLMKHLTSNTNQYISEHRKRKNSGEYIWILERGKIVEWDEYGNPLRMTGTITDITSDMKSREALKASQDLYRTTIDNLDESILLVDEKLNIKLFNKAFEKWASIFSPSYENLIGRKVYNALKTLPDFIWQEDKYKELFDKKQNIIDELEHKIKFRTLHSEIRRIPVIENNTAKQIVTVIRDITDKKQFEKEREKLLLQLMETNDVLEDLNAELHQSNNDLEEFAYAASHDLQEPLRMIASYVQLLARRYKGKLSTEADEFIGYAVEGAKRMQKLISDLLKWSRLGTKGQELKKRDLQEIFERVLSNLKIAIEESKAEITSDPLPAISIDSTQMVQLLQNLIGNAIKYNDTDTPRIHLSCEHSDGYYHFEVRDNGIGIDPRYTDRIFVIFQRLHSHNDYSGTGIGLALCKKIVERHGGKIGVKQNQPKGSIFYFTIPEKPKIRESFHSNESGSKALAA